MAYVMIIQMHRWSVGGVKDPGSIPKNPRPDEACNDIENAQVNCDDVD